MKSFPADIDHLIHEQIMPYHTKDLSPTLSRRTARTPVESQPPSNFQRTPSVNSLGALGLRPVLPPVPGHGTTPHTPSMQQKSLPPTPAMSHRNEFLLINERLFLIKKKELIKIYKIRGRQLCFLISNFFWWHYQNSQQ